MPDAGLKLRWMERNGSESVVTWELEGSAGATRITLVHNGFAPGADDEGYYLGWADFLVRLKHMVEGDASWRGPLVTSVVR